MVNGNRLSRNPLKSGQCFLPIFLCHLQSMSHKFHVAIPSNRVNVSYMMTPGWNALGILMSQSPQIGSMFPTFSPRSFWPGLFYVCRNPLKSGQCFLHEDLQEGDLILGLSVAIPSNRVNVSYKCLQFVEIVKEKKKSQSPQIGSMFPTKL